MKFSDKFLKDIEWFYKMRKIYDFDGRDNYFNKNGINIINPSKDGIDGVSSFYLWDSNGVLTKTKHPNILTMLLKVKGSVNLHIKMYSEDRGRGVLPLIEFKKICQEYKTPQWFFDAVENQKYKYYESNKKRNS